MIEFMCKCDVQFNNYVYDATYNMIIGCSVLLHLYNNLSLPIYINQLSINRTNL